MGTSRGEDLALAHRLADAADAITLSRYQAIDLSITTKPDNTPVTDADLSASVTGVLSGLEMLVLRRTATGLLIPSMEQRTFSAEYQRGQPSLL